MAELLCNTRSLAAAIGVGSPACRRRRVLSSVVTFSPSYTRSFGPLRSSPGLDGRWQRRALKDEPREHRAPMKLVSFTTKWWEKGLQSNMKDITSAQDLVDSLLSAGDKLVIVDFYSPGCGGCKALHPKICQFAETNPNLLFLQVNYEEHKSMCYSLNVHVLPFFRFYRGAQGRLCSFSCTNATIKKFKDALAKHGTDRCSLGPARGLEEAELLALAANRDLSFTYPGKTDELTLSPGELVGPVLAGVHSAPRPNKGNALVTAWR